MDSKLISNLKSSTYETIPVSDRALLVMLAALPDATSSRRCGG